jgi:hypothetical protein
MSANLAQPILTALRASGAITAQLTAYMGSFPIFTRRPAPTDAPYPMIMVSPDISVSDLDGINDFRPQQQRDITVYGQNDTPAKYRVVEAMAYQIRDLFHRQRRALLVAGWSVTDIRAIGPIPAPTDDEQTVGRLVSLTIQLAKAR